MKPAPPAHDYYSSETDHVQLSRLVIENAWRVDNGRADTVHELYVDDGKLTLPPGPVRGRDALREWCRQIGQEGSRKLYEATRAAYRTSALLLS